MARAPENFEKMVEEVRRQLGLRQEGLAHELGVNFATVNGWENGKTAPSKQALSIFGNFSTRMTRQGRLNHVQA